MSNENEHNWQSENAVTKAVEEMRAVSEDSQGAPETPQPAPSALTPAELLAELRSWVPARRKKRYAGLRAGEEGDMTVTLRGETYIVRVGTREWRAAEKKFRCEGISNVLTHVNSTVEKSAQFYQIALSRHHSELSLDAVMDLMDVRGTVAEGEHEPATLQQAVALAMHANKPVLFPDEEVDPKELADMQTRLTVLLGALAQLRDMAAESQT